MSFLQQRATPDTDANARWLAKVTAVRERWAEQRAVSTRALEDKLNKIAADTAAEMEKGESPAAKHTKALKTRAQYDDMRRVLELPDAVYEELDFTESLLKDRTKRTWPNGKPAQLRPIQNKMLTVAREADGGFFMASTGAGKSFAAILSGSVMRDVSRVLIFTPASTVSNLRAEYFRLRNLFNVLPLGSALRIYSHEELSKAREEAQGDLLDELILHNGGVPEKTLIVFDEAHRFKNLTSARGGRVMRAVLKHHGLRVVVMSGTMSSKSVTDAAHLAWYALRDGTPYPVRWSGPASAKEGHRLLHLEALAACTDVNGIPTRDDWQIVKPLVCKYYPHLEAGFWQIPTPDRTSLVRQAFKHRLLSTKGVVLTTESEIAGLTLHIAGLYPVVPQVIKDAICQLETGTDFNDMPIPDAAAGARLRKQVAQGFYYIWAWPKDAQNIPIVDLDWKAARSQWSKCVRTEIEHNARTGYDSEFLVYNNVRRQVLALCTTDIERDWVNHIARTVKDNKTWEDFHTPAEALNIWHRLRRRAENSTLCNAWLDWSAVQKHKLEPPVRGIWLSTFLLDHAVAWAKAQPSPPILWYEHREVGEKLQALGVPAYGAGTDPPASGGLVALSIFVHSEGKNLQDRWHRQAVLCPPSSGVRWEQMLGRTYREGQQNSEVHCFVYMHDDAFVDALNSARAGAAYAEDQGNKQKLLYSHYSADVKLFKLAYGADFAEAVDADAETL